MAPDGWQLLAKSFASGTTVPSQAENWGYLCGGEELPGSADTAPRKVGGVYRTLSCCTSAILVGDVSACVKCVNKPGPESSDCTVRCTCLGTGPVRRASQDRALGVTLSLTSQCNPKTPQGRGRPSRGSCRPHSSLSAAFREGGRCLCN